VRELAVPVLTAADPKANLTDLIVRNAAEAPRAVGFRRPVDDTWQNVTWAQFDAQVRRLASGLVAAGIGPGDRVGLMSKTRYEWTLTDFAIWFAGAVTVPIYETSSEEQVAWILADSGAIACLVETGKHAATVTAVRQGLPALRHLWQLDAGALDELTELGRDVGDDELEARRSTLSAPRSRRSSTPQAPPAGRRAASSPTPTSASWPPTRSPGCP
jgi:long-chain acyl-CoA synthetase